MAGTLTYSLRLRVLFTIGYSALCACLFSADLRPEQFGAVGDGIHDDSAAIQAAVDSMLYPGPSGYSQGGKLVFSANRKYLCSTTIRISCNAQAVGIELAGETRGPYIAGSIATLVFSGTAPGITIDTARNVTASDLLLTGTGRKAYGIAVDCSEGAGGSKQVTIQRCGFIGWKVAITHNDSQTVPQGDGMLLEHCMIADCGTAFASGQDQARATMLRDCEILNCDCYVDTVTYGRHRGTPPTIEGGQANGIKSLFNVGTVGPFVVRSLYAEDIGGIGTICQYANCNNQPAKFDGCHFVIRADATDPMLTFGTDVRFSGGTIQSYGKQLTFTEAANCTTDAPQLVFECSSLRHNGPDGKAGIVCNRKRVLFEQSTVFDPKQAGNNSAGMVRL